MILHPYEHMNFVKRARRCGVLIGMIRLDLGDESWGCRF